MSLKFCSLASGSSGNALYIESNKTKILVDAGFSGKVIENLLLKANVLPESLDAILITHEHIDHIKGAGVLSRRYNIPILANEETWLAMLNKIGKIEEKNIIVFKNDIDFTLRDLDIHPISTYHDSANSCGYIINKNNKKISILTDTGIINQRMKNLISGSDVYLIEANHDIEMLKNGSYSYNLKKRILSVKGHLSNEDCAFTLGEVLTGNQENVILGHLSQENNTEQMAYDTVNNYLTNLGLDTNRDIFLSLANRSNISNQIILEP
ncbi:MBL fold metallo-hydrolase [Miniphocaeibacter massiliensis]|uniref:MBL fold metallo-hydrolase n=1 Tax=Miniphocaeibacter massiliensis TaxID=2041841 RepID=UPI000C1C71BB|nr:MBL fold metallo-hydrolase [Miniphocaeibacter massiliensis]